MLDRHFHINTPFYGAWTKYNWNRDDWGLGLAKHRVDALAQSHAYYQANKEKISLYKKRWWIKRGKMLAENRL